MSTIADIVNELFRTHRNPTTGREYSAAEVSRALDGELDHSYISKLRRGEVPNPGRNALLALCTFFKVEPRTFFPELDTLSPANTPIKQRAITTSPEVQQILDQLYQALAREKKAHEANETEEPEETGEQQCNPPT